MKKTELKNIARQATAVSRGEIKPARVTRIEGNAGPTLLPDARLRIFGDEFEQLDVSPAAGFIEPRMD